MKAHHGLLPCLALAGWCLTAWAEQMDGFSSRLEMLSYRQETDIWRSSPFSGIATVPDHTLAEELRPDLAWRSSSLAASLKPRASISTADGKGHVTTWLNEGSVRWQPAPGWSLQGGREALLWGPAMFWNPSNPIFTTGNKANPKREVTGADILRARWQIDSRWAITGIGTVGRRDNGTGPRHLSAMKLDWSGEDTAAAFIAAGEPGKAPSWQGYAQWTASDATLLYTELAWRSAPAYTIAVPETSPTGWAPIGTQSRRNAMGLLGSSYTFENNWTVYAEAWHNGNGLGRSDMARLGAAVEALGKLPVRTAAAQLGTLIDEPAPLGRNYAGFQLGNDSTGSTTWKIRLTRNLDDDSMEWVGMLDHNFSDHLQGWVNLMRRCGSRDSEYGRWVRGSSMVGFTWFAW